MEYVGIAWATTLIRTSFPPIDRIFSFQLESFFPTLSLIATNIWVLDLPMRDGRPRYFVYLVSYIGPIKCRTSSLVA